MALPSSGKISMSQVAAELGRSATAKTSLGESAVRALAGRSSGSISMSHLHGKSSSLLHTTITIGDIQHPPYVVQWGFDATGMGSMGSNSVAGGRSIKTIYYSAANNMYGGGMVVYGRKSGTWWRTMTVGSTVTSRTGSGYTGEYSYGNTYWTRGGWHGIPYQ